MADLLITPASSLIEFKSGSTNVVTSTQTLKPDGALIISSSTVYVSSSVDPSTDNVYDLGTATLRWRTLYANNITASVITGSFVGNIAFTGKTNNYVPKWSSNTLTATSSIYDSGTGVGIGTTTPSSSFDVVGGAMRAMGTGAPAGGSGIELHFGGNIGAIHAYDRDTLVYRPLYLDGRGTYINAGSGGNVGIGTDSPIDIFHLRSSSTSGSLYITDSTYYNNINGLTVYAALQSLTGSGFFPRLKLARWTGGTSTILSYIGFINDGGRYDLNFAIGSVNTGSSYTNELDNSKIRMTIQYDTGYVGIGTITPASLLHVAGTIAGTNSVSASMSPSFWSLSHTGISFLQDPNNERVLAYGYVGDGTKPVFQVASKPFTATPGAAWNADSNLLLTVIGSGNVGIGITNPSSLLHINSGQVRLGNGGGESFSTSVNSGTGILFGQLASQYGIEFIGSTSSSGYGHRILAADLGSGTTVLKIQGRANSGTFSDFVSITTAGYVGIGVTSPVAKFTVNGVIRGYGGNNGWGEINLEADNSTYTGLQLRNETSHWDIKTVSATNLALYTNNTYGQGITISGSNGYVGIGTTDASSFRLQTSGSIGPNNNASFDLGSPSLKWRNIYATSLSGSFSGSVVFTGKTDNYVPKWSSNTLTGTSLISDNGSDVRIGPQPAKLIINSYFGTEILRFEYDATDYHYIDASFHGSNPVANYLGFNIEYNSSDIRRVMTLLGNGNVGIGCTDPTALLSLGDHGNNALPTNTKIWITGASGGVPSSTPASRISLGVDANQDYGAFIAAINYDAGIAQICQLGTRAGGVDYSTLNINYNKVGINTLSPSSSLHVKSLVAYSGQLSSSLLVEGGNNGILLNVTDDLSNSLFSINNSSGLPVFEAYNDDRIIMGQYNQSDFVLKNNSVMLGYSASLNAKLVVNGNVGIGTTSPNDLLHISKDFGTTSGNGLILENANALGYGAAIRFYNAITGQGRAEAARIYGSNEGSNIGKLIFATRNAGTITDAVTILGSGNVGIGTANPSAKLEVYDASGAQVVVSDGTLKIITGAVSAYGTPYFGTLSNHSLHFLTNFSAKAILTSTGIFGVGSTSVASGSAQTIYTLGPGSIGALAICTENASTTRPHPGLVIHNSYNVSYLNQPAIWFNAANNGIDPLDPYGGGIAWEMSALVSGGSLFQIAQISSGTRSVYQTILSNGKVGIGTTNPSYILHIKDGDNSLMYAGPNTTFGAYLVVGSAPSSRIGSAIAQVIATNGNLHLDSGTSNSIYINYWSETTTTINPNGGSVGIGTDTPATKLHVQGNVYVTGQVGIGANNTGGELQLIKGSTNGTSGTIALKFDTVASVDTNSTSGKSFVGWLKVTIAGCNTGTNGLDGARFIPIYG